MKVWKYGSMQVCNYSSTRSLGAHWAPTSSWRPIGPAFCPFFDFVLAHQQQRSTRVTFFNYETRMRLSSIQSCRWRRDENFLTLNLRLRDEIEIYYLHSQALRRESEIFWSDLSFRDENESSELLTFNELSDFNGLNKLWVSGFLVAPKPTGVATVQAISLLHDFYFAFPLGSLLKYCQLRLWFFPGDKN